MPIDFDRPRARLGAVAALTAAAFALRAWGLDRYVVDLHELFQLHTVVRIASLGEFVSQLRDKPLHVLLDPLLTFGLSRVSTELWWLRLQPILIGTACVPAFYALARKTGGTASALIAAGLLAASLHHIEFSGIVDFYPILVLWTLVSSHRIVIAAERGRPADFALYAVTMAGFLYTHPWAVLVGGFHGAWLAGFHRGRLKSFLAAAAAAGVLFLPWFAYSFSRVVGHPVATYTGIGHARPLAELLWTVRCWAGEPERGLYDPGSYYYWVVAGGLFYLALALLGAWRLREEKRWDSRWWLAAGFALGGMPAVFIVDWAFSYEYMPRQTIFVLPFFLMFVAEGLRWRPARWAAPAAVVLFVVLFGHYSRQLSKMKNRFIQSARLTEPSIRPGDTLLFDEPNFASWFLYYYDRAAFYRVGRP
ncbi:MAG: glycosyltransferase family 39 protein, partial [Elusimicrobiota bacterium]